MCRRSLRRAAGKTWSTPSITLSIALSHGSRHGAWKTTPRSGPAPRTSLSARMIDPYDFSVRPARIDRTVDLPHPEWPIRLTNSPSRIVRSKSFTTSYGPVGDGNDLASFQISQYFFG